MTKRLRQYIIILFHILTFVSYGQTFKGKGDSPSGIYKCYLKINPDSTVLFNYYDDRGNVAFADFKGSIKKTNDSLYQIKCEMVFGQFHMMNVYKDKLTIVVDSGAEKLHTIKKIKVKYSNGLDTTFNIKFQKKSFFGSGAATAVHDIYKSQYDSDILVDIGYKDIIFNKKVLFKISGPSALTFSAHVSETFYIKFIGDTIKTVGEPILQTGHLIMKKI